MPIVNAVIAGDGNRVIRTMTLKDLLNTHAREKSLGRTGINRDIRPFSAWSLANSIRSNALCGLNSLLASLWAEVFKDVRFSVSMPETALGDRVLSVVPEPTARPVANDLNRHNNDVAIWRNDLRYDDAMGMEENEPGSLTPPDPTGDTGTELRNHLWVNGGFALRNEPDLRPIRRSNSDDLSRLSTKDSNLN